MKKSFISVIALLFLGLNSIFAQNSISKPEPVIYSVIVNKVPNDFSYPLIGFVNIARGNNKGFELGFVNVTAGNFAGLQVAFVNSVGNNFSGLQSGFINSIGSDLKGVQNGFFNTVNNVMGLQNGFVNVVGSNVSGMQNGFINATGKELKGVQSGFINSARSTVGLQTGFVNSTRKLSGIQLGFINTVDTLETGVTVGFLSFVKHGGFSAIEISANENYLINISYKTGTKNFYSFPVLSYNPNSVDKYAIGFGIGSNLHISKHFFFNPELASSFDISTNLREVTREITSLNAGFGYSISEHLDILAGPSVYWSNKIVSTLNNNNHIIWTFENNNELINGLDLGFKCAVRYVF